MTQSAVPECRFCLANALLDDAPLARTDRFYVLASRDPTLPQSVMVIPERHAPDPFAMPAEDWADMPAALAAAKAALARFSPQGFTLGWNVGPIGGQTQPHVHLHVIARHATPGVEEQGIRGLLKAWMASLRPGAPTAD